MTKKVLTIAVPILSVEVVPYGPAFINGILKHNGYDSSAWDLNIDLFHRHSDIWDTIVNLFGNRAYLSDGAKLLHVRQIIKTIKTLARQKLRAEKPDIILLSVFSSQSLDLVIPLSSIIKDLLPDCYVVVGGRGLDNTERVTKLSYAELYSKYLPVDCWYIGDAENNLLSVLQTRHQGLFVSPPVASKDLESLPPAAWDGYNLSLYQTNFEKEFRFPIIGSKGCVRDCTFCDVAASWPKYVFRKGEDIAKEMVNTYTSTGINRFEFTDNLVNGSIKNFRAMNEYISNCLPNTLDYYGYAICRPKNEFPKTDFQLAKSAGASKFKVGIETGSDQVRHNLKKKFTNEDINWFAENCYDNDIRQEWLMFVGYPTETEQDFQDSIDLLKKHRHLTNNGKISVFLSLPMMLTSGSAFMQKYSEEYGLSHNRDDPWGDFFWTSNLFTQNTFDVRVNRWKRFVEAINKYGYANESTRQAEKFLEIDELEKIYKEIQSNGKKFIPISASTIYPNKETHI